MALRDEFHPSDFLLLDERIERHHRLFLKARAAPPRLQLHPILHCVLHCVLPTFIPRTVLTLLILFVHR